MVRRRRLVSFVRAMGLVLLVDTDAAAAAAAVTAAHGIADDEDGLLLRFMMLYFGRQGRKRRDTKLAYPEAVRSAGLLNEENDAENLRAFRMNPGVQAFHLELFGFLASTYVRS